MERNLTGEDLAAAQIREWRYSYAPSFGGDRPAELGELRSKGRSLPAHLVGQVQVPYDEDWADRQE
jgi:hypothetical protein